LVAVIRRVRRLVPGARQVEVAAHDYDRSGKPDCAWDDPQATQALVSELVIDALVVLEAVGDLGLDDEQAEAVALLTLVADRDVEPSERPGSWRISRRVAKDGVTSTVDPAARHTRKTATAKRDGCKMGSGGTSLSSCLASLCSGWGCSTTDRNERKTDEALLARMLEWLMQVLRLRGLLHRCR
jgi:hypothetical protein